jgi:hypothetical protein
VNSRVGWRLGPEKVVGWLGFGLSSPFLSVFDVEHQKWLGRGPRPIQPTTFLAPSHPPPLPFAESVPPLVRFSFPRVSDLLLPMPLFSYLHPSLSLAPPLNQQ